MDALPYICPIGKHLAVAAQWCHLLCPPSLSDSMRFLVIIKLLHLISKSKIKKRPNLITLGWQVLWLSKFIMERNLLLIKPASFECKFNKDLLSIEYYIVGTQKKKECGILFCLYPLKQQKKKEHHVHFLCYLWD